MILLVLLVLLQYANDTVNMTYDVSYENVVDGDCDLPKSNDDEANCGMLVFKWLISEMSLNQLYLSVLIAKL